VTQRDIDSLAERIDAEVLLNQRLGFDAGEFQSASVKKKRGSPFQAS
jgi:hypothetical protein